jgi:RHS repeat-associated protein
MTAFTNAIYPSEDAAYTHDATGQLLGATRSDPADDESYVYDDNGNRITANGASYTIGLNNRIESDGTFNYTYDAEGNITLITDVATGDYRELEWDHRNRLVKVTQFDSNDAEQWRVEYVYDAFNRLVSRTEFTAGSPTATTENLFIYDGYQMILKFDASGNVQTRTLWGENVDQILATEDAAGNVTWPLTDHLNTVRDIVSYDSGTDTTTLENHIAYDSFGNAVSETNPSVDSDFLFTARYPDVTTGLQWNLNRWYSPSIGRWMSEDPIGFSAGDPNLGRYVLNSPTEFVDPYGQEGQKKSPADAREYVKTHGGDGHLLFYTPSALERVFPEVRDAIDSDPRQCVVESVPQLIESGRQYAKDTGLRIRILEIATHGSPLRVPLGVGEDAVIHNRNAFQVGQQLKNGIPFDENGYAIILTSCNAGLDPSERGMPAQLAKGAGCPVWAAGGYVQGQLLNRNAKVHPFADGRGPAPDKAFGAQSYKEELEDLLKILERQGNAEAAERGRKFKLEIPDSASETWYLFSP